MDIFIIYIERAVESVQDGISRRIGSREIQKTKVYRVLMDTLYHHKKNKSHADERQSPQDLASCKKRKTRQGISREKQASRHATKY